MVKKFIISNYQRAKGLYTKYERLLMPATLVVGFLVDYFTFANIQITITFALLFFYWFLAGAVIIFTHLYDAQKLPGLAQFKYLRLFAPLAIQFAFGALLSASLIFYWFSGAFSVSWPLVAAIVVLMVFNDAFRHYFVKPLVQTSVYFFITLSLFSLALPFLFNSLSAWTFVVATVASLALFSLDIFIISSVATHLKAQRRNIFAAIFSIALVMNVLYFTDIMPPIPLALREAGMYHSIKASNGWYAMQAERENFLQSVIFGQTLHLEPQKRAYLYTAIFAPANVQTTIVHHWQYYDLEKKDWVTKDKLPFVILGGRKAGYKAYSWESDFEEGRWRVSVENQRGQVLGRVRFTVKIVNEPVPLQAVVR